MSFTPNIPVPTQSLGQTNASILNNFASLRNTLSNGSGSGGVPNHIDVNLTGAGKHIFVQMPVKTPSAQNLTLTGEFGLIAQTATSGSSELYFTRDGVNISGTPIYYQLTAGIPTIGSTGQTFLPGGILMKWATDTGATDGSAVNFPVAFPNNLFSLQVTIIQGSSPINTIGVNNPTKTGFNIRTNASGGISFFYLAIGN